MHEVGDEYICNRLDIPMLKYYTVGEIYTLDSVDNRKFKPFFLTTNRVNEFARWDTGDLWGMFTPVKSLPRKEQFHLRMTGRRPA